MRFVAEHALLFQLAAGLLAAALALTVAVVAMRPRPAARVGRHRSTLTADARPYTARHAELVSA